MMVAETRNAENVSGVSNVVYNLLSILNNTLEGTAAREQYQQDAQGDAEALACFEQLQQQARQDVDTLRQLVTSWLGS